jgi:hypothetical protein
MARIKSEGLKPEIIDAGGGDQFVLRKNPLKYSGQFEVRTLAANGKICTGKAKETVN